MRLRAAIPIGQRREPMVPRRASVERPPIARGERVGYKLGERWGL
jgi:hypothetical protein